MARKDSFKVRQVHLFKNKPAAKRAAETLRKAGICARVRPSNKTTQKRTPSLTWAVDQGQMRRNASFKNKWASLGGKP